MIADLTKRSTPLRPGDPDRLGPYRLLGRLGSGGMGVVFLARDPGDRLVAVKMVHAELAGDDQFRRRFRSEVARARQVPPFCTAELLDADPDAPRPYLVVEYVDGPSLADVVTERGPLTAANLHAVAIGVATALTAIHDAGVIHRDLKPRNVLLAPGSPKVIDFGIARALEATSAETRGDQMMGTVAYMAPERFGADPGTSLTAAADVFAWGVVVAYAGTGRTPFGADSPAATAARILTQPPDLSGLTGSLRDLVELALATDPADRPTARELLDLLLARGPQRSPQLLEALARQPALRTAAAGAQAGAHAVTAGGPAGGDPGGSGGGWYPTGTAGFGATGAGGTAGSGDTAAPGGPAAVDGGAAGDTGLPGGTVGGTVRGTVRGTVAGSVGGADALRGGEAGGGAAGGAGPDGQDSDGRDSDGRDSDGRGADGWGADGWGADGRDSDGWGADGRDSDGRDLDDRLADGWHGVASGGRVPRQRARRAAGPVPRSDSRRPAHAAGYRHRPWVVVLACLGAAALVLGAGATAAELSGLTDVVRPGSTVEGLAAERTSSSAGPLSGGSPSAVPANQAPARTRIALPGRSLLSDPLNTQAGWYDSSQDDDSSCVFTAGVLRAQRQDRGTYQCIGPERDFGGDLSITVTTRLETAGSCASLLFHHREGDAYQVRACSDRIDVRVVRADGGPKQLGTLPLNDPLAVREQAELGLLVRGGAVEVHLSAEPVGTVPLTEPDLVKGQIVLGMDVTSTVDAPPFAVSFANIDIRQL